MKNTFTINSSSKNEKVENFFKKAMEELKTFFLINWIENTPVVFLVDSRKDFDVLVNRKTEKWVVGQCFEKNKILFLSPESYEKESIHKYSDEEYYFLLKHELSHFFYNIYTKEKGPNWLSEGFAVFSSGELKKKKRVGEFKNFLKYYTDFDQKIYEESGFAVEVLIKKFGKEKVLNFLKKLPGIENEEMFKKCFEEHFNFKLEYSSFNKLL